MGYKMEVLDVYDVHGNKLNKTTVRGNLELVEGEEFIKIVTVWFRSGIRYLIQLTSEQKGSIYAVTGGHVPTGSTSREQAKVECKEELDSARCSRNRKDIYYSFHRCGNESGIHAGHVP